MEIKKKQKVIEAVQRFIFNKLDLNIEMREEWDKGEEGAFFKSEYYPISTSKLGLMQIAISEIEAEVKAFYCLEPNEYYGKLNVEIHFTYKHPCGGGNGYSRTYKLKTTSCSSGDLTLRENI